MKTTGSVILAVALGLTMCGFHVTSFHDESCNCTKEMQTGITVEDANFERAYICGGGGGCCYDIWNSAPRIFMKLK